jgi:hypothetical protein
VETGEHAEKAVEEGILKGLNEESYLFLDVRRSFDASTDQQTGI